MALEFSVLASGSRGNASLVRLDGTGILIDVGIGPRVLADRFAMVGDRWETVRGALLTHTHCDHAQDATLRWMARQRIPLHCHEGHVEEAGHRPGFRALASEGLLRLFDDRPFLVAPGLWVEPFELSHSGPTFGFRLQGRASRRGRPATLGYLTDTGCWDDHTADALADVDLLGIEFNHDVEMQRRSGRSPALIWRNLGDRGHLSNDQGAALLSAVLERSAPGAIKSVLLLHLSDDCNRPDLALQSARQALIHSDRRAVLNAAHPSVPLGHFRIKPGRRTRPKVIAGFPWEA